MLRFNSYHVFTAASITSFIQRSTERARVHQIYHRRILFYGSPFREHFWKNQTPDLQRHFQILNHLGLSIGRIGRTREPLELTSHCDFLFLRGGVLTPRPLASFYRVDFFRLMNTLDRGELGVVKIRDEYSWHSARIFFSTRTAFMRASSDRATTFQETKNVLILRRRFDLLPRN
jgi:hypothetical protein